MLKYFNWKVAVCLSNVKCKNIQGGFLTGPPDFHFLHLLQPCAGPPKCLLLFSLSLQLTLQETGVNSLWKGTITSIFRTLVHQRSDSIFFVEQISHADMLLLGSICTSVAPAAALGQRQEALRPSGFYLFLWQSRRIKIRGTLFLLWDRSRQLFLSSLSADQMLRGAATP